ncbi:MAG: inositol monophosphatase family protein [Propionibacteriaceae bacterium]|nr:inositol monophosphatase family protein [Propionibacteriaceae bacterium]
MTDHVRGEVLDQLEALAAQAAVACGRFIVDDRPPSVEVAGTKSSPTDVVTEMDRAGETLIHSLIRAARPHDGILGEEGSDVVGDSGITWVVDPIDGTVNYLYDIPAYAVSVAAVVGSPTTPGSWRPLAGAVYNPVLDELYLASRGRGATLESGGARRRLEIQDVPASQALIATGFNYDASTRQWQGGLLAEILPHVRDVRRLGSAALDLCHVASGRVNASYESRLNSWDIAAGWLVVEEAGGVVRGLDGAAPSPDLVMAGPERLVDDLARIVMPATRQAPTP